MSVKGLEIQKPVDQYYDTNTLYIDCGVATESQIAESLKIAINNAQKILAQREKDKSINNIAEKINKLKKNRKFKDVKKFESKLKTIRTKSLSDFNREKCMYKINLLVTKDGAYHGYGYIRVSSTKIYWMLLGRNPDGSERFEETLDPNWTPPEKTEEKLSFDEIIKINKNKTWADVAEDEEKHIQPVIRKSLDPLITMPGFKYDKEQLKHLKELAVLNEEDPDSVPDTGYFEISRGYAKEAPSGTIKHRICARNVPNWVPLEAFVTTFKPYVTNGGDKYPKVNFIQTKKGKIVFVNFDPSTTDALFALLMTRKTRLMHPEKKLTCELIFMHAFENKKSKSRY